MINRLSRPLMAVTLIACAKSPSTDEAWRAQPPEPLEKRPFVIPDPVRGELSNGIPVVVVENHEVPMVYIRLNLNIGGYTDPESLPGLASVTMDMLNEGAGDMGAAEISAELRKLGSSLGTGAGSDGSELSLSTLKSRVEPSLDLLATIALEPTFPEEDWELLQGKRLQDLEAAQKDPGKMSWRAWSRTMYGESYLGHLSTEDAYGGMTTDQMRGWYSQHVRPNNAVLLVGGDTSLTEILPLLEARFGGWEVSDDAASDGTVFQTLPSADQLPEHEGSTIYLIDSPGAAQSVIRGGTQVCSRTDDDYAAFTLANHVIGGQFSARINLNLREDKGWTYGARSSTSHNHLPGVWSVRTNVVTEHTGDAVKEILSELSGSLSDRPITHEELERSKDSMLGTWPLSFEQPSYLLDQTRDIDRYGLPADWLSGNEARFRAVSIEQARESWATHIVPDNLTWVIVGDLEQIQPQLSDLGIRMVQIDANGSAQP